MTKPYEYYTWHYFDPHEIQWVLFTILWWMTSIMIDNKLNKKCSQRLDCDVVKGYLFKLVVVG